MNLIAKTLLTIIAVPFAVALLTSCQGSSRDRAQDPLAKGYQHIDRGEYDAAIDQLTELAKQDPRPEVRVTLASAYAARAGIKVPQYWGFVVGFKAPLKDETDLGPQGVVENLQKVAKQNSANLSPADAEALAGFVRAVGLWEMYKVRIDAIPVVQAKAHQDIVEAVELLSQVQTPGGRLYRAILDLILLKSAMVSQPEMWSRFETVVTKTVAGDSQGLCSFDFVKFTTSLRPLSQHLNDTLTDLTIAFPEQSTNLAPAIAQSQQFDHAIVKARQQLRQRKGCR